jgi:hypothetical protein
VCRSRLAAVGRSDVAADELLDAVIEAYGVARKDVEPLLTWAAD